MTPARQLAGWSRADAGGGGGDGGFGAGSPVRLQWSRDAGTSARPRWVPWARMSCHGNPGGVLGAGGEATARPYPCSRLRWSGRVRTQERDYPRDSSSPPSLAYAGRGRALSAQGLAWRGRRWGLLQGGGGGRLMGGYESQKLGGGFRACCGGKKAGIGHVVSVLIMEGASKGVNASQACFGVGGSGNAERNRGAEIPFTRDLKALYKLCTRTLQFGEVSHKEVKRRGKGQRTTRSLSLGLSWPAHSKGLRWEVTVSWEAERCGGTLAFQSGTSGPCPPGGDKAIGLYFSLKTTFPLPTTLSA